MRLVIASLQLAVAAAGLRADRPQLMLDAVRKMSPAALGDALLATGHPHIVEAIVHPIGLEPPMPWVPEIDLVAEARPSAESGFCSTEVYRVTLEPPTPYVPGSGTVAARPVALKVDTRYHLASDRPRLTIDRCQAPVDSFFSVRATERDRQFFLARLLAWAKGQAEVGAAMPFDVTFKDRMAEDAERTARHHSGVFPQTAPPDVKRITSARAALNALPIGSITNVSVDPDADVLNLKRADLVRARQESLDISQIDLDGEWTVDMLTKGSRVVRLHIVRAFPMPL